jgi:signal transduction histidine kinase
VAGVRRLVELLDAGAGSRSLEATLATVLHDPTVHVAYPIEGGRRFVDDQGRLVVAPSVDARRRRAVTPIERGGVLVALVEHDADLDPDLLSREVGAASRLAVDNERLAALLRAQVHELQASRERIVAAGDAARGRLERDLHDGAQQRLLAVSYELRLAQAAAQGAVADRRAAIDAAVAGIDAALAELRELAHGIWPAVLAEAGLEAALGSLADEAPIPVELAGIPDERFPARTEAAAYLAATEAVRRAVSGGASGLAIRADLAADQLRIEARISGLVAPGPWLRVDDRVGAAGGRSSVLSDPVAGTLLTVELPCV